MDQDFPEIYSFPADNWKLGPLGHALSFAEPVCLWEQHPRTTSRLSSSRTSRWAYLGLLPRSTIQIQNYQLHSRCYKRGEAEKVVPLDVDPFEAAQALHSDSKTWASYADCCKRFDKELPPFLGGTAGCIGYDTGRYFESIRGSGPPKGVPELQAWFIDTLVAIDRERNSAYLICWPSTEPRRVALRAKLRECLETFQTPLGPRPQQLRSNVQVEDINPRIDKKSFIQMVSRAKDYICAGDVFQVVLGNSIELQNAPNPFSFYAALEQLNPSPYHFLFSLQGGALVGASPEVMLLGEKSDSANSHQVSMRLVAGTYPRSKTSELKTKEALRSDPKEMAEHIMLVDHARNDIGRVSEIGSVHVEDLGSVETYKDVHHLVSQVSGRLRSKATFWDALRSCFPIATLTGTPKIRAMEIIAELEGPSRGFFGGAVFMMGHDSFLDAGVIIRSALLNPTSTLIQAGAGIVYDSDPEREYYECLWKAKAVIDVCLSLPAQK